MKQTLTYTNPAVDLSPLDRILKTPARCHLVGATAMSLLMAVSVVCWASPESLLPQRHHSVDEIHRATRLISQARQHRESLKLAKADFADVAARADAIRQWLPEEIDWQQRRQSLRRLASEYDLQWFRLDPGTFETRDRVGIWKAKIELHGSFPNVTRFICRLHQMPHPIWCDETRIQRSPPSAFERDQETCSVFLSIRIPVAASGTIAGKLLEETLVSKSHSGHSP
ncbi:hypothetical protein [Roseiconus lacunae]|uniref:Uncharacterized protein n=1 Tax=Roseiconus lacunae TaxID=2605694 RepID=A0ABT7PJA6_9BACT|nr:hypothetical protein [Roseiconus lacunae]MDM4016569.1 hypothetical protein [Roseiconus lacunae]